MTGSAASPAPLVLVVEEETHERDAIAEHLREAGYGVCDASTTDEALASLEGSSEIRMVVTDAHVPDGAAFVAKPYLFEHLGPTLARLAGRPRR